MLKSKKKYLKIRLLNKNGNGSTGDVDTIAATRLKTVAQNDRQSFFDLLDTRETGLTEEAALEKQQQYGANEVDHEKAPSWYIQLLQAFINPFIGVLIIIALVSLITDVFMAAPGDRDYKTIIVVSIMVMLSSLLRFWQEFRSNNAAEKLKSMVKTTATVIRSGEGGGKQELNIRDLVPGDVVVLSAGDMIPADCRIF
jgi:Mg2+-importing ATPase